MKRREEGGGRKEEGGGRKEGRRRRRRAICNCHDLLLAPLLLFPEHPRLVIRASFPGCIPPPPLPCLLLPLAAILTSLSLFWKIALC